MSEEIQTLAEGHSASVPEVTTTSESTSNESVAVENLEVENPESEQNPKLFTQEEVDEMVSKRLAREQRKLQRQSAQTVHQPVVDVNQPLNPEQFESTEQYVEALALQRAEQIAQEKEFNVRQAQVIEAWGEKEEVTRDKYPDYEQVVHNPNLRITDVMANVIQGSEIGPEIAYHLGLNPKESARIAALPPFAQASEIGKLEVKLVANPPVKKTSSAPEPFKGIRSGGSDTINRFDTTDPRSVKTMSTSEWIEADRKREMEALRKRLNI
jgi:AraC-like DNA-binding protein